MPTSYYSLITYLCKYITKAEPRSDASKNILEMASIPETATVTSNLRSLMIQEVSGGRDVSKEEACRIVLGEAGTRCSH